MSAVPALDVARVVDRFARVVAACRGSDVETQEIPGGWVLSDPASEGEEFPSSNQNRAYFLGLARPVMPEEVRAALEAMRQLGRRRVFVWVGPSAFEEHVRPGFQTIGLREWPFVRYPVLTRAVETVVEETGTALRIVVVRADNAQQVLAGIGPWFSERGTATAGRLIESGRAELHAALDGMRVVSIGLLIVDGQWGYLGFAGTDPAHRGRGGQSALIRSRLERAAALGGACLRRRPRSRHRCGTWSGRGLRRSLQRGCLCGRRAGNAP